MDDPVCSAILKQKPYLPEETAECYRIRTEQRRLPFFVISAGDLARRHFLDYQLSLWMDKEDRDRITWIVDNEGGPGSEKNESGFARYMTPGEIDCTWKHYLVHSHYASPPLQL